MMRPMKIAGKELVFGQGCLEHIETLQGTKAIIITSGDILEKTGILPIVRNHLENANIESKTFYDVEPDPSFSTVMKGAEMMKEFNPDLIIAVGGGSAMDAAKGMWIFYEHPHLSSLAEIMPPNTFPKLHNKALMVCIPSTSGTASEVSRSIVITDDSTGFKYGLGNMEMMPDIAICDPFVTKTMPGFLTASTGMDALTHAVEAFTSNRANYLSDILAIQATKDIVENLELAFNNPENLEYREYMLNASVIAGMAFTNVSLGIVHSMAHTLGSYFHVPHGVANAILLPYVIKYNSHNKEAADKYQQLANKCGVESFYQVVVKMNENLKIPKNLKEYIKDDIAFDQRLNEMALMSLKDGCTKTNPVIPSYEEFRKILDAAYYGMEL